MPTYKQMHVRVAPEKRVVKHWSAQSKSMPQDALDDVDWDMFRASSADVNEFVDATVSFVGTLVEEVTHTITIKTFSN